MKGYKMTKNTGLLLLGGFIFLFSTPSRADVVNDTFDFNNTQIMGLNSASLSDDSTAMIVNPGGIGLKTDGEIFFSNSINSSFGQTNLLGTFSNFNLGLQQFTPQNKNLPPLRKYFLGTAYPIFQGLSAGLSYSNVQSTDASALSAQSIDFGILSRPFEFLSLGAVIRNLNTPIIGKTQINRAYTLSFGFRPFSWDRFSILADAEWVEGSKPDQIRGFLGVDSELINGISLKGKASSDANFKNLSFMAEASIAFPYLSLGYARNFDAQPKDVGYAKLSLNRSRTMLEGYEEYFAEIKLKGSISSSKQFGRGFLSSGFNNSVYDYLANIEKAENDKTIAGIILNISSLDSGFSVNEELRRKLEKFKKSGKKVVAYIYSADIKDYYLASIADHIIIHPSGELQFQGVGSLNYFYKGLMDKVGVESQFQKYGKYKSAVESSTKYSGSDEDKEQRLALMKQFYSSVEDAVTSSRKLTPQDLQTIVDNKLLMSSRESKELKLVDEIGYYDQLPELLGKYVQNQKIKKYGIVDIDRRVYKEYAWADDYKVAVVNASGAIVEGSSTSDFLSGESSMGADTIVKLLEKVRNADDIKAVVLRVDSGGGSSLASDIIGREVKRFKDVGKPIVVSMGNVAASGGYWISTDADKVLANKNTITGSIGVFTGKMNFDKLFSKLGINVEAIKIGKHADAFSEHRPFSDEELKILDKSAQEIYRMFLERVASGRKIEISKVEALAQGRVYSGEEAKKLNLIDQIGGLEEAVEIAKELAKIKDKNVKVLNARLSEVEMMSSNPIQETLASFYPYVMWNLVSKNNALVIMPNFDF